MIQRVLASKTFVSYVLASVTGLTLYFKRPYRSVDQYDKKDPTKIGAHKKSNPRYYAEYTVTQAMAELGITRHPPSPSRSAGTAAPDSESAEIEPSR